MHLETRGRWFAALWPARRQIACALVPLFLAILPAVVQTKEARCLFVVLVMGVFWISEILPLAVTALIPLVAYPLLDVVGAKIVSKEYFPDSNIIFMGSLIMAIAVERTNLHERVALRILLCTGTGPRWLMLGFQLATALISMWITNTATTAMMLPILTRVIVELERCYKLQKRTVFTNSTANFSSEPVLPTTAPPLPDLNAPVPPASASVTFYEPQSCCNMSASSSSSSSSPIPSIPPLSKPQQDNKDMSSDNLEAIRANFRTSSATDMRQMRIYKGLLLSICYSASIGGIGTLIGTAPNMVLVDNMDKLYANDSPISFSNWMLFAVPMMLFMLFICWLWLQFAFIGFGISDKEADKAVRRILKEKYKSLGPIGYAEGTVIVCFSTQALLWITRSPGFIAGWSALFKPKFVTDGTTAMAVALLLFVLPARNPLNTIRDALHAEKADSEGVSPSAQAADQWPTILTWQDISENFSWGTIILLGGSFAMAKGVESSGLSAWFSDRLLMVAWLPDWMFVATAILLATALTEFSSNVATATIFVPILSSIARVKCADPPTLILPVVVSTSFAFMFPAGTPPNAIVFSSGLLKVTDMVGFFYKHTNIVYIAYRNYKDRLQ